MTRNEHFQLVVLKGLTAVSRAFLDHKDTSEESKKSLNDFGKSVIGFARLWKGGQGVKKDDAKSIPGRSKKSR